MSFSKALKRWHRIDSVRSIKPINYNLSLSNLEFGGKWSYNGLIKITSSVKSSTDEVVLNVKELVITGAEVYSKDGGCKLVE